MNTTARQSIPTIPDAQTPASIVAVELMHLFDSLPLFGYSQITLFESDVPGATATLRAWAEANGLEVIVTQLSDGSAQSTSVQGKYPGPNIHVQARLK